MCTLVEHDCVSRLFTASPFVSIASFFSLPLLVIAIFSFSSSFFFSFSNFDKIAKYKLLFRITFDFVINKD